MIDLSIIIISYNTKQYTLQTLASVYESLKKSSLSTEIIVVENSSTDGSLEAIIKQYPKVVIIQTSTLIGFGSANNLGFARAKGSTVLFLNSDVIVQKDAIDKMYLAIQEHPDMLISCQLLNEDMSLQHQGGSLPNWLNLSTWSLGLDHVSLVRKLCKPYQQQYAISQGDTLETGWIGGTAIMMKASIFDQIGRWDEQIFMYGEDVEFCFRAKRMGISSGIVLTSQIIHLKNKSTGSSKASIIGEMKYLIYMMKKHHSTETNLLLIPYLKTVIGLGAITRWLIFALLPKHEERSHAYLEAFKAVFLA